MDDGTVSEGEGFLSRWSRRKQEAREAAAEPPAPQEEAPEEQAAVPPPLEPFDPESLPPVDSLGADSDYTGFLAGNVPQELKRLALRKAWSSDPVIAGFRGFAEYDWDCNAPGYGKLLATDRIADLLDRIATDEKPPEEEEEETSQDDAAVAEAEEEDTLPPTPALPCSAGEGALGDAAAVPSPAKAGEG